MTLPRALTQSVPATVLRPRRFTPHLPVSGRTCHVVRPHLYAARVRPPLKRAQGIDRQLNNARRVAGYHLIQAIMVYNLVDDVASIIDHTQPCEYLARVPSTQQRSMCPSYISIGKGC
jgi:hypothetical protein